MKLKSDLSDETYNARVGKIVLSIDLGVLGPRHSGSNMNICALVENCRGLRVVCDVTRLEDHVTGPAR